LPAEASAEADGAGSGNRTRIFWVEASGSAVELRPHWDIVNRKLDEFPSRGESDIKKSLGDGPGPSGNWIAFLQARLRCCGLDGHKKSDFGCRVAATLFAVTV
jgi:hypothetical protein